MLWEICRPPDDMKLHMWSGTDLFSKQMTVLEESGILIINMRSQTRRTSGRVSSDLRVFLFISVIFTELGLCWIVLLAANHLCRLMCGAIRYFPDWIYFSIIRTPTFLCSDLGGHTFVWSVSCYHLLELSRCTPQDAWIMVMSLNILCLHHFRFWKGRKLLIAKSCEEGGCETTMAPWTHSNQQAAPITVYISIY